MQTFLPYPDFTASAQSLDSKRLGKQRVEAIQIMRTLLGISTRGWRNHPAVLMWEGHEAALWRYTDAICTEWVERGYRNAACAQHLADLAAVIDLTDQSIPQWLGDEEFHSSHRSNLLRKAPHHYGQLWPDADPMAPYVWPVSTTSK